MEFDKSRVFTSINADELQPGDIVITADILSILKENVEKGKLIRELHKVEGENYSNRFVVKSDDYDLNGEVIFYSLAYLIERKENCTNCGKHEDCGFVQNQSRFANLNRCEDWKPKTEQKAEGYRWVNYRPFKDTDELIKVWDAKYRYAYGLERIDRGLDMPHIWVRRKGANTKGQLITEFGDGWGVGVGRGEAYNMTDLWMHFTFLDGSPCGVEE